MNDQLISMAVTIVLLAVNSTSSRNKFRRAFLKMFNAIGEAYARDREFMDGAKFVQMESSLK